MRREAKRLLTKACDSLVLSIEIFNRPHDRARVTGTLIYLDHSFEMLMKSAILHSGGSIRDEAESNTIGYSLCVGRSLSDGTIRYLTEEQAQLLRIINGLRDAEQHHLLDISEAQLYVHIQSGVTLFRDILRNVFGKDLVDYLPRRVLPISTSPPLTIEALFDTEIAEVKKLLSPGNRRHVEAFARLRSLMVVERATVGDVILPTDKELGAVAKHLVSGKPWDEVFP